jgi:hypothetical protein
MSARDSLPPAGSAKLPQNTEALPLALSLLLGLSGSVLLVHLLLSGRYGYFRDELYFLDCGRNLAWGYVDMAPMIALISRIALLLGGSLQVLRTIAGIGGAGIVALTMLIAWRLGGDRFAQGFAGLCAAVAPMYLATASLMTMNVFEAWYWMGCVYVLLRIIQTGNSRLWIWFGVIAGLGIMNKHSTLFFGLALVAGLILTPQRREFAKPWIWIGGVVAGLIFLPNVIWQVQHHFPTLEDLHNVAASGKNVVLGPGQFIGQQILVFHPVISLVWMMGLWFLLLGRGTKYRVLGWIYLTLLVLFIVLHGKDYYLAPAYPMLFAGGAVAIEDWLSRGRVTAGKPWPKIAMASVALTAGAHIAPAVLPEVAGFYNSLPPDERRNTAILAGNYGEAGAIDMFGPKYGLPTALSGHQNHYYWGTLGFTGDNLITIQYGPRYLGEICNSVEKIGDHYHPWGMAEENHAIYFCRGLKKPLAEIWEDQKHWN